MDWLQFSASVIGSLAWPIALVALGFMFRDQFKGLLKKIKHAKGGGFELDFSEDVKRIVAEAEQVKHEAAPIEPGMKFGNPTAIQGPPPDDKDKLYELLKERPSALILDSWRDVERATQDVITELGFDMGATTRRNAPPTLWPRLLQTNGVLSAEEAALLADLRTLRNKVAHATDWEPTVPDALDYHRTAGLITAVLRNKLAETKQLKQ